MTPRGSICSVVSTGLQNFVYNADYESDEEKDEEEVSCATFKDIFLLGKIFCFLSTWN